MAYLGDSDMPAGNGVTVLQRVDLKTVPVDLGDLSKQGLFMLAGSKPCGSLTVTRSVVEAMMIFR